MTTSESNIRNGATQPEEITSPPISLSKRPPGLTAYLIILPLALMFTLVVFWKGKIDRAVADGAEGY